MARSKPTPGKGKAKPGTGKGKKAGDFPHDRTGERKLSVDRVVEALRASAGVKTAAAQMLNCGRTTLYEFIAEHPEIATALTEIEEEIKDLCDVQIVNAIRAGDMQTVRWYSELKARDRGYNRRMELGGPNGGPIPVAPSIDLSTLSEDELEVLAKLAAKRENQAQAA